MANHIVTRRLLLVPPDRISAYDFVLDPPIPARGEVLTRLSLWWFTQLEALVPNHVVSAEVPDAVRGRAVLVERLEMLPVARVSAAEVADLTRGRLVRPTGGGDRTAGPVRVVGPDGRLVAIAAWQDGRPAPDRILLGRTPEVGMQMQGQGEEGAPPMIVTVKKVEAEKVTLDANHPLAGQDLTFELELMEVV